MKHRFRLEVLAFALAAAPASVALAQAGGPGGEPGASPSSSSNDNDNPGTSRQAASDKLTNHVLIHGNLGIGFPAGSLATDLPFSDVAGIGLTLGGGIGIGLSRYVALDLQATYGMFSAPEDGSTSSGRSIDGGIGLAYHLAQGLAIDPWISFGVGYRSATFTSLTFNQTKTITDGTFQGLDFARIGIGADFFPLPWGGAGAFFDVAIGTTVMRPDPDDLRPSVYAAFQMGARIELDPIGRRSLAPATQEIASRFRPSGEERSEGRERADSGAQAERGGRILWRSF